MTRKDKDHKDSVIEVGDSLIEVAQTIFINQIDYKQKLTLNLRDYEYISFDDEKIGYKIIEIVDYLTSQQIRLFEDFCDEDGLITNSIEQYSAIFETVTLSSDNSKIHLQFSKAMIDLLT